MYGLGLVLPQKDIAARVFADEDVYDIGYRTGVTVWGAVPDEPKTDWTAWLLVGLVVAIMIAGEMQQRRAK